MSSYNGLDESLCKLFVEEHIKYAKILKSLFTQTQYFTTNYIIKSSNELINEWLNNYKSERPLFIPLMKKRDSSEKWLYEINKHILPPHTIINYEDISLLPIECDILFMDDWCLSGNNCAGVIDDITYELKYKLKKNVLINFYVVSVIMTEFATNHIKKIHKNTFVYYKNKIEIFKDLSLEFNDFIKTFQPDTEWTAYPVHLEYKIANQFGSFNKIYSKCRSSEINKPY
jgi:hypothetical protein